MFPVIGRAPVVLPTFKGKYLQDARYTTKTGMERRHRGAEHEIEAQDMNAVYLGIYEGVHDHSDLRPFVAMVDGVVEISPGDHHIER